MDRKYSLALLAVIAVSIVFGMIAGGKLNTPEGVLAAREGLVLSQAPLVGTGALPTDFADMAEAAIPAVVSVSNTSVLKASDESEHPLRDDPFFHWFFGQPDRRERAPDRDSPYQREEPPERQQSFGSGFIISKDGYVLTNHHVVNGATRLRVELQNGDRYDAKVIGTDPSIDLALIKIDGEGKNFPTLPLGDSDALRVGEWVIAIGNPLNLQYTVTVGVVSAKGRRVPIGETDMGVANFIQTDAAINRGNSGGPLLDGRGRVVGMNTAILRGGFPGAQGMAEGIGFALPISEARNSVEQILESGSVQRGYLGILMNQDRINDSARDYYDLPDANGVIVQEVVPNEAADKAGIEAGDIIRKVDGEPVKDNIDLVGRIAHRRPGEKVRVEIFRDAKPRTVTVTLGARDSEKIAQGPRGNRRPSAGGEGEEDAQDEAENLGVKVQDLTAGWRRRLNLEDDVDGVLVTDVDIASDALDEGLGTGAVITHINEVPIRSVENWKRAFRSLKPAQPVRLTVVEGQSRRSVFLRAPAR